MINVSQNRIILEQLILQPDKNIGQIGTNKRKECYAKKTI